MIHGGRSFARLSMRTESDLVNNAFKLIASRGRLGLRNSISELIKVALVEITDIELGETLDLIMTICAHF